jgi:hypothetical protein
MAQVFAFPKIKQINDSAAPSVATPREDLAAQRQMVAAAMNTWMQGRPLTQREQRIIDTVVDTNYFGQLGRLAMGN